MAHVQKFVVKNQRMFKKTFSYYVMHITVAMLVGYVVTGSVNMAIALSLLEPTVQAAAFFFHEKVWEQKQRPSKPIPCLKRMRIPDTGHASRRDFYLLHVKSYI